MKFFRSVSVLLLLASTAFAQYNVRRDSSSNLLDNIVVPSGKSIIISRNNLSAGTALTLGTHYYDSLSANRTLTFSGTPVEGSQTSVKLVVTGVRTLTVPSCKRVGEANSAITSVTLYPGVHTMTWTYCGAEYILNDSVGVLSNDVATIDPTTTDDSSLGYSKHSKWINTSTAKLWECIDATASAAVWKRLGDAYVAGGTDVVIADGGTNASTAYAGYDNLSLQGADVASSGTINLETATGNTVDVTGTTTITAITLNQGHTRIVRFTGALTLTNGASLVLPGGANITTATGDFAIFKGYASSVVRCVVYSKASGAAVVGGGSGTVTTASVVSANGFAGSVATATTTPAITLTTTITGVLKGNGTAISAASAGTDYYAPGSTDVAVADGGSGASSAAAARVNLTPATSALAALAIDWAVAGTFSKTLAANSTFTFSNAVDGETIIVALTNTASNFTVTWPSVSWTGGTAPTQTIGAKTDVYTFVKIGSTIYGSVVQNF